MNVLYNYVSVTNTVMTVAQSERKAVLHRSLHRYCTLSKNGCPHYIPKLIAWDPRFHGNAYAFSWKRLFQDP